jgi:hypothetical protein
MNVRRRASGVALAAVFLVSVATAGGADAQAVPNAASTQAEKNAAITAPLTEIGRVRARSPYCAALAKARLGIDSAIAYEYQMPVIAADLRKVSFASELHKHRSLKKLERDVTALWDFATAGRDDVLALRKAAYAEGVDDARRAEMLALANAVDGAKERQKMLAKSVARTLGIYAEAPVRTIVTTPEDEMRSSNPFSGSTWSSSRGANSSNPEETPPPSAYARFHPDAPEEFARSQALFSTFSAEERIRDDMAVAAKHATLAMALGGCAP